MNRTDHARPAIEEMMRDSAMVGAGQYGPVRQACTIRILLGTARHPHQYTPLPLPLHPAFMPELRQVSTLMMRSRRLCPVETNCRELFDQVRGPPVDIGFSNHQPHSPHPGPSFFRIHFDGKANRVR